MKLENVTIRCHTFGGVAARSRVIKKWQIDEVRSADMKDSEERKSQEVYVRDKWYLLMDTDVTDAQVADVGGTQWEK